MFVNFKHILVVTEGEVFKLFCSHELKWLNMSYLLQSVIVGLNHRNIKQLLMWEK